MPDAATITSTTPVTSKLPMPKLGLGTFRMTGAACTEAVLGALDLGYRHIDTAEMYGNEAEVGAALSRTGIPRKSIHVTTKVWHENLAPAAMRAACETSLRKLKLDHVDLYLIHWPSPSMDLPRALEALVKIQQDGLATRIGVSNFTVALLKQAVASGAPIMCNQIEYHVMLDQSKVLDYARSQGIAVTAYCPLARGDLSSVPALDAIGKKHGATASQIALAWLLCQDGVATIPKAARPENQRSNHGALAITLDHADLAAIAALTKTNRLVNPGFAPAWD